MLAQNKFLAHPAAMISTLGEALDGGWRLTVYCRWGKRDGMKSVRECKASVEVDLATLVWTRGRAFPVSDLGSRMKCPRCGSRRVVIAFAPPRNTDAAIVSKCGLRRTPFCGSLGHCLPATCQDRYAPAPPS